MEIWTILSSGTFGERRQMFPPAEGIGRNGLRDGQETYDAGESILKNSLICTKNCSDYHIYFAVPYKMTTFASGIRSLEPRTKSQEPGTRNQEPGTKTHYLRLLVCSLETAPP